MLAEVGVVVEAQLGIHAKHIPTLNLSERVDLNLGSIGSLEELVELDEDVGGLLDVGGLEAELLSGFDGELLGESVVEVDGDGKDGGGVITGDVLNAVVKESQK